MPKVSVIIPVYNREQYVAEAIESVLAQTFQDIEIITIDDGSFDRSSEILAAYAKRYPKKIHYLEHEYHRNRGVSASRNLGILYAKGEYVAFLDADDLWCSEKLQRQVRILESHPNVGFVSCSLSVIDESGKPTIAMYGTEILGTNLPNGVSTAFEALFSRETTLGLGSTLLIRKSILFEVGLFDEDLHHGEDLVMSDKIAYLYPVYFFHQAFVKYRVHASNASWSWIECGQETHLHYTLLVRNCRWLKNHSLEWGNKAFRIKLANLSQKAYHTKHISRWGYYRLLSFLFPFHFLNWELIKIFISLILGFHTTHKIQQALKYLRKKRRIEC